MDHHRRRSHEPEAPAVRGPTVGRGFRRRDAPETDDVVGIRTDGFRRVVGVGSDQDAAGAAAAAAVVDVGVDAADEDEKRRSFGESLSSEVINHPGKLKKNLNRSGIPGKSPVPVIEVEFVVEF